MTVSEAIKLCMKKLGYVTVGLPNGEELPLGWRFVEFAAAIIPDGELEIIAAGKASDWRKQFKLIFPDKQDRNTITPTSRFYRCKFVRTANGPA